MEIRRGRRVVYGRLSEERSSIAANQGREKQQEGSIAGRIADRRIMLAGHWLSAMLKRVDGD
jgi:hypothetical protein